MKALGARIGTRIGALAATGLAAIAIAGCGGGDESSTAALSKDDFLAQADQICAKGDQELNDAGQQLAQGGRPSEEDLNQFISDTLVPNLESQADQIRGLGAPAGDEEQVNAIVDALDTGIEQIKADPSGAVSGGGGSFDDANKLAQDYGLTDCGNG